MKTFIAFLLITFIFPSCSKANDSELAEKIQIHIRQEWRIEVTKKGRISIRSSTDSNPMANAHTHENIVEFDKVIKMLNDDLASFPDGGEARIKIVWACIPGKKDKVPVSEDFIFKLLQLASGHWEFPGLTSRLDERLKKHPILTDINKQNRALHPTDGAPVPENTKE
jgi:hypothetical protein